MRTAELILQYKEIRINAEDTILYLLSSYVKKACHYGPKNNQFIVIDLLSCTF